MSKWVLFPEWQRAALTACAIASVFVAPPAFADDHRHRSRTDRHPHHASSHRSDYRDRCEQGHAHGRHDRHSHGYEHPRHAYHRHSDAAQPRYGNDWHFHSGRYWAPPSHRGRYCVDSHHYHAAHYHVAPQDYYAYYYPRFRHHGPVGVSFIITIPLF
jgi:hypothetical protein